MTEKTIAQLTYELGQKYRYDHAYPVSDDDDWAVKTARAICADLSDRSGIKHEMGRVDDEVRSDIISMLADVIRFGHAQGMK